MAERTALQIEFSNMVQLDPLEKVEAAEVDIQRKPW